METALYGDNEIKTGEDTQQNGDVEGTHQKYWLVDWCRLRKKDSSSLYDRLGSALPRSFISILGGIGNNLKFG